MSAAFSDDNDVLQAAFIKFEEQMLKQIDESIMARAKIAQEASLKNVDKPPSDGTKLSK